MTTRRSIYTTRAWRALRLRIIARDGGVCQVQVPGVCIGVASQADHIVPVAVDADRVMDPANLRASCGPCNAWLGGRLGAARSRATRRRPGRRSGRVDDPGYRAW